MTLAAPFGLKSAHLRRIEATRRDPIQRVPTPLRALRAGLWLLALLTLSTACGRDGGADAGQIYMLNFAYGIDVDRKMASTVGLTRCVRP